jgi:hypothetical protein
MGRGTVPETEVCRRRVIVEMGEKSSQTVNVCNGRGRSGVYDWIIRFPRDVEVLETIRQNAATQQSLAAFVGWLKSHLGGAVERVPPDQDPLLNGAWRAPDDPAPDFSQLILPLLERSIDLLVREHLAFPTAHRREHNLHSYLYAQLQRDEQLARKWPLAGGDEVYLLQQEWPERPHTERLGSFDLKTLWPLTDRRLGPSLKKGRGLYDMVILSPDCVAGHTEAEFINGTFPPVVAVEFGLIENYGHLREDAAKLVNNQVAHGYLVHLVQPGCTDNFDAVETFLERLGEISTVRSAYARVERDHGRVKYHYKRLGDRRVIHSDTLPCPDQ